MGPASSLAEMGAPIPRFEVSPNDIPPLKESGLPLNAYMLHNLARVELNAIDLAWDTVGWFRPIFEILGEGFFTDFARIADDESPNLVAALRGYWSLDSGQGNF
ncbi:hypothetical protein NL676_020203 [Syzygium grande]|nr:hypothetical protein NL676_020203 [Syzygium grande]